MCNKLGKYKLDMEKDMVTSDLLTPVAQHGPSSCVPDFFEVRGTLLVWAKTELGRLFGGTRRVSQMASYQIGMAYQI